VNVAMSEPVLVLASASARRRELLALLGLPFVVHAANVDEIAHPGESPAQLAARLSATKAAAVRGQLAGRPPRESGRLIVGADTVVALGGEMFGKPDGPADAARMLRALRGKTHTVVSAVAVVEAATGRAAIRISSTQVTMRDYSDAEIEAYVASGDPGDKAGAYAIQHVGFRPVAHIEGCYTGVVGLPLGALVKALAHFGVFPSVPGGVATACSEWSGQPCCLATGASAPAPSSGGR
jgi:MAF protein